jgi:glutamyl-tRNA synthetase
VAAAASAPHAEHEGVNYTGTCAHRSVADAGPLAATGRLFAWRFRVREWPRFTDDVVGEVKLAPAHSGGDFVVWKSAGTPAYQLAVVVDDAEMGITEVIRGDDLIPSTPRQLLIYQALGWVAPRFAHVPLVVGEDGRRLAKRHGDTRLSSLRAAGVLPESLVGLLAWSCGWLAEPGPITPKDLLPRFRLDRVPQRPFVLTADLLSRIGYKPLSVVSPRSTTCE